MNKSYFLKIYYYSKINFFQKQITNETASHK